VVRAVWHGVYGARVSVDAVDLVVGGTREATHPEGVASGVALGLLFLTRPEAAVLLGALVVVWPWTGGDGGTSSQPRCSPVSAAEKSSRTVR